MPTMRNDLTCSKSGKTKGDSMKPTYEELVTMLRELVELIDDDMIAEYYPFHSTKRKLRDAGEELLKRLDERG